MHVTGKEEEGSEARPEEESHEACISERLGIPSAQTLAHEETYQEWSWQDTPRYGGNTLLLRELPEIEKITGPTSLWNGLREIIRLTDSGRLCREGCAGS